MDYNYKDTIIDKNNIKKAKSPTLVFITFILTISISVFSFTYLSDGFGGWYMLKYLSFFLFVLTLAVFKKRALEYVRVGHLAFLMLVIITSIVTLYNVDGSSLYSTIMLIGITVLIYTSALVIFSKITEEMFVKLLSVLLLIISILVIVPSFTLTFNNSYYYLIGDRFRFIGLFNNSNELARFSAIAVLLSLRLWTLKTWKKSYLLIIMVMSLHIIIKTDSRASLVLSLVALSLFIVNWLVIKLGKRQFWLMSYFVLLLLLIGVGSYLLTSPFKTMAIDLNELSSGRVNIWTDLISKLKGFSLMFGSGSGRTGLAASKVLTNGYLEIVNHHGLVGLFLNLLIIGYLLFLKLRSTLNGNKLSKIQGISIILSFLLYFVFEGGIVSIGNITGIYFWLELSQTEI